MLYLEDYLEMIEHLPSELRDRFTEMREMDLSVQNRVDSLEDRQKSFFASCKRSRPSSLEREEELLQIRKEYKKVGEEASEKIGLAEDCYSLVDRYLRKLDQELHKFKLELEADNRGITEVLEKRSLEMDAPTPNALKENRLPRKHNRKQHSTTSHGGSMSGSTPLGPSGQLSDRKNSYSSLVEGLMGSSQEYPSSTSSPSSQTTFPLQHMGPGGNAIAAAASQAIQATQQLVPGRRTSSLKASYEAINLGVQAHEFSIGRELAGAAQTALAATHLGSNSFGESSGSAGSGIPNKKQKLSKRSNAALDSSTPQQVLDVVNGGGGSSSLGDETGLLDPSLIGGSNNSPSTEELLSAGSSQDQEWNYDPSEPRYCICNQVSYGDMVACDNQDCPYEWFHYPCVAITAPPKGKWYCPTCSANMARRKGRK